MASMGMWNEHNFIWLMFESLCAALTHTPVQGQKAHSQAVRDRGAV